jgi:small nuclear ribonucleoprotein (snRNP)-like protein
VGALIKTRSFLRRERWRDFLSSSFFSYKKKSPEEQTLIILHPKLGQMVNGIVLPIKKVFGLVDSKISVEIKDEGRKLQGRLVAVDEYLNIHMDETIEFVDNQRGRSLGTVVIRGNNILTIAPVI